MPTSNSGRGFTQHPRLGNYLPTGLVLTMIHNSTTYSSIDVGVHVVISIDVGVHVVISIGVGVHVVISIDVGVHVVISIDVGVHVVIRF